MFDHFTRIYESQARLLEQVLALMNRQNANGENQSNTNGDNSNIGTGAEMELWIMTSIFCTRGLMRSAQGLLRRPFLLGMLTNGLNTWRASLTWSVWIDRRSSWRPLNWKRIPMNHGKQHGGLLRVMKRTLLGVFSIGSSLKSLFRIISRTKRPRSSGHWNRMT